MPTHPTVNCSRRADWYNADPGNVKLWDAQTGAFLASLTAPVDEGGVLKLAFSPDGKLLAGAVGELANPKPPGLIVIWDLDARRPLITLRGHSARITALAFSPDGKTLASGGEDRTVRFWDFAGGRETGRIDNKLGWVRFVAFTPDGKTLAIGSGKSLRLWDVEGNRLRAMIEPDGFWVLDAWRWHRMETRWPRPERQSAPTTAFEQVRCGCTTSPKTLPYAAPELAFELDGPEKANHNREWPFCSVAFTRDGRFVAALAMTTVAIWDVTTATLRDYFDRSSGSGNDSLAASPDGRWLAITEVGSPHMVDITPPAAP